MESSAYLLLALGAAVAGFVWYRYGWRAGIVAALTVGASALALLGRRRPVAAPPAKPNETVRRTAGDIVAEHRAEADARIDAAVASPDREAEVAKLVDARRRRR